MLLGHPPDHLGDEHRLADARPAEQADLAALLVRGEQVDDLDAGLEHLGAGLELVERWRRAVDLPFLGDVEAVPIGVEAVAEHVPHVAERHVTHRHPEPSTQVTHRCARVSPSVGFIADGPDPGVADLLGDLGEHGHRLTVDGHVERHGRVDLR